MPTAISTRRKRMRRKYRKMAAAVAGAAVLSSAMLPGMPVAKAFAAPAAEATQTVDATQPASTTETKDTSQTGEKEQRENRDKERERERERERHREVRSPVQYVIDNAYRLGFDSNDRFSLLSRTDHRAVVQVRHDGQTFKVELERDGRDWDVVAVRGIGDMNHPATYTTGGFYPVVARTLGAWTAPAETVIYRTTVYDTWQWARSQYPSDMKLGILLSDPRLANIVTHIPAGILDRTDFGRQLLVFAHLGSVAPQGYGIGISRVVQTGNDLTVTVRMKSPEIGGQLATKTDDYLSLDRLTLNFTSPIKITFVDQNGTVLATHTITPR